jgi:formamidopyrimidine-DNA glycosylase
VTLYVEALNARVAGRRLVKVDLRSPFVLRSVEPPLERIAGATVDAVRRIGKRIVFEFGAASPASSLQHPAPVFLVLHLMIAGRLRWREPGQKPGIRSKLFLALIEFEHGTLLFTEASSKKRASLQVVAGEAALHALDRGGVEPLAVGVAAFREALTRESHTLKRSLTDPRLFSGIGNAYSDEILHAARLSPLKLTRSLTEEESARLFDATQRTLIGWTDRLRDELAGRFPEKVTAFHDGMAVHGRFKLPCPVCAAPVQRIVYAENECNYCARCQTGGRLLADRSLSRLLKDDWPRRLEE